MHMLLYLMQDHKQKHPVLAYSLLAPLRLDILKTALTQNMTTASQKRLCPPDLELIMCLCGHQHMHAGETAHPNL